MTRTLTVERRFLTGSLPTLPVVHDLLTRHRLESTARSLGHYSEVMLREFYATYVVTLRASLDKRSKPGKHGQLQHVRARGMRVDISLSTFRRFLYGADTDATKTPLAPKFYYRWKLVKDVHFQCESVLRETTKRWKAQNISL